MKAYYLKKSALLALLKNALETHDPSVFNNPYQKCKSRKVSQKDLLENYDGTFQSALLAFYYTVHAVIEPNAASIERLIEATDERLKEMQENHDLQGDYLCPNCSIKRVLQTTSQIIEEGTTHPLERLFSEMSGSGGIGGILALALVGSRGQG